MDQTLGGLAGTPLTLADEHLSELVRRGEVTEVREGAALVRQGDRTDYVYVVLEGTACVELDGRQVGPPVEAGECIGELAVLDQAPRAATVSACSDMRLLTFTAEGFAAALDEVPGLREHVTRALTRRLRGVSSSWSQLAVDADVLLEAFVALQGAAAEPQDRARAVEQAASLVRRVAEEQATATAQLSVLTPAETRVAELVAEGLSNAAIAARLFVSEHTVASHIKHAFTKLGCTSRVTLAAAVLKAR